MQTLACEQEPYLNCSCQNFYVQPHNGWREVEDGGRGKMEGGGMMEGGG